MGNLFENLQNHHHIKPEEFHILYMTSGLLSVSISGRKFSSIIKFEDASYKKGSDKTTIVLRIENFELTQEECFFDNLMKEKDILFQVSLYGRKITFEGQLKKIDVDSRKSKNALFVFSSISPLWTDLLKYACAVEPIKKTTTPILYEKDGMYREILVECESFEMKKQKNGYIHVSLKKATNAFYFDSIKKHIKKSTFTLFFFKNEEEYPLKCKIINAGSHYLKLAPI